MHVGQRVGQLAGVRAHDAVLGDGGVVVELGLARGVHGFLQLLHGPAGAHVDRAVIERDGQRQGQAVAAQCLPEMPAEQTGRLFFGTGADIVGVDVAVIVQIKDEVVAVRARTPGAGIALPGIAQTAFFGLPGQIRDPAQGDAVIGDAAGIGFVVGKAAFPAGRERMGQSEIVAHMPSCMAVE